MTLVELQERLLSRHDLWSRTTSDLDAASACHVLREGGPSIAWLIGHVATNTVSVSEALSGVAPPQAQALAERAARPHAGATDDAAWADLRSIWEAVSAELRLALASLSEADLEAVPLIEIHPGFEDGLATRRAFLEGHLFHLTWHAGQVGMLRAALGLGWV